MQSLADQVLVWLHQAIRCLVYLILRVQGVHAEIVRLRLNFDSSLPMTVERFMHLSNNITKKECFSALEKAGAPDIFKSQNLIFGVRILFSDYLLMLSFLFDARLRQLLL